MKEEIQEGVDFIYEAHKNQFRNNGLQPFLSHPMDVMKMVTRWGIRELVVLLTCLLHDTDEDCPEITNDDIKEKFGEEVAYYVKELTFDGSYPKHEYIKSFINATPQALVVKLADRFVNTMDFAYHEDRYAPKYFKKADALIEAFQKRRNEIEEVFGKAVLHRIDQTLEEVKKKMRSMEK